MLINLDCQLFVGDEDILIEDEGALKAVVGTYEDDDGDDVIVTFGDRLGRKIYVLNKSFAEKLGKALLEKAK